MRVRNVCGDRAEVELARAPGCFNPSVEVIRQFPQLDPNFVRRYVHDSSGSAGFCSGTTSPIKHRCEHPAMEVEQVDVGWRPSGSRSGARPVEYQRAAPRFCSAQNWLDFLVGHEDALIGLESLCAPSLPSHGLASAARPKDLVDCARDDFRGNVVTFDAHRLLNAADHTSSTLGRLPILQQAPHLGQLRRPRDGWSDWSVRHTPRVRLGRRQCNGVTSSVM